MARTTANIKDAFARIRDLIPLPKAGGAKTLDEAREGLRDRMAAGKAPHCPCCGQTAKLYPRSINRGALKALRALDHSVYMTAQQLRNAAGGGGDYTNLSSFGLALISADDKHWRITSKGQDFLRGKIRIEKAALKFAGKTIGMDESAWLHISDIDENFDLDKLMDADRITGALVPMSSPPTGNFPSHRELSPSALGAQT